MDSHVTMNAIDEYDVRQAFDVLDECQDGVVTVENLQTLYLGLGFVPPKTVPELRQLVRVYQPHDDCNVSLETTLKLLSKASRKNRSQVLRHGFDLLDRGSKGYIDASDVRHLAVEVVAGEGSAAVSEAQASEMLEYFSSKARRTNGGNDQPPTLGPEEFLNIFSPRDP